MAATPPSNSKSSGDDRAAGATAMPLTFEDKMTQFWQTNRMAVLGLCALVLLAILGKGAWERIQQSRENEVQSAFAAAKTPEQLKAFAAAHPDHALAGVAELEIADQAYTAGKAADAVAAYDKAASVLGDGPLAARARLGRALAKVQAGNAADGESELKQIVADTSQLKAVRSEAAYQLATLAADARNYTDVQTYCNQLNQIEPESMWARRALALQASLPRSTLLNSPVAPAASPAGSPSGPNVQIKLPGK